MKSATLILAIVLLGALSIPLVVLPHAYDAFRLPKELALRGEAILIVAALLAALVMGERTRMRIDRWTLLPIAAMVWMVLVAMTSTNTIVSASRVVAGVATLIVFFATMRSAERERAFLPLLAVPFIAASANAIIDILQELNVWMPFGTQSDVRHHYQCTALIGNPNEVGGYLSVAALACIAAAIADSARRKWFAFGATLLVAGVIASQTLTAVAALIAGAFVLFALVSWKHALRAALVATLIAIVLFIAVAPLRNRATQMARALRGGDYNTLITDRLTPFVAASLMASEHPIAGVGPGAFAWNYYEYKVRAEERYPPLRQAWSRGVNFGEVHDDHLQLLAESGVPGYLLFIALLLLLGGISLRFDVVDAPPRQRFAMLLALPLVVLWVVLSLAQFPIETTVVRMLIVHFAALCVAWRPS